MSEQRDGGPAFPLSEQMAARREFQSGMSLRDYFAAKAMQGFLSQSHAGPKEWTDMGHGWGEDCANQLNAHRRSVAASLADFAYAIADEMLEARQR
jgi:hypothetical protein